MQKHILHVLIWLALLQATVYVPHLVSFHLNIFLRCMEDECNFAALAATSRDAILDQ